MHTFGLEREKGLNLVDKRTYRITTPGEAPLQTAYIRSLCSDGKSRIWIALNDRLLESRFPYHEYTSIKLPSPNGKPSYINSFFYEKGKERLWICTSNGIFVYTDSTQELRHLRLWDKPTLLHAFPRQGRAVLAHHMGRRTVATPDR